MLKNVSPQNRGGFRPVKHPSRKFSETNPANPGEEKPQELVDAVAKATAAVVGPTVEAADGFDLALAAAARDTKKHFQNARQRRVDAYQEYRASREAPVREPKRKKSSPGVSTLEELEAEIEDDQMIDIENEQAREMVERGEAPDVASALAMLGAVDGDDGSFSFPSAAGDAEAEDEYDSGDDDYQDVLRGFQSGL
jgi:hypothetical protein